MLLKDKTTDTLVEILDVQTLIDPNESNVTAQGQAGQEEQNPQPYAKQELIFPSGETLPRCWLDANYKASK